MGMEKRKFPRINTNLKIGYEFVKWNEKKLIKLEKPNFTNIHDISISGIGLSKLPELKQNLLGQLSRGRKKVRLGIYLPDREIPLMTFARLIWYQFGSGENEIKRYGFVFLDVSVSFFEEMTIFIKKHL